MDEKTENLIDQISKKNKFEVQAKNSSESGKHPAESTLVGLSLVSFGMGIQNGAFIGLFYIGLVISLIDIPKLLNRHESKLSKLLKSNTLYYTAGGIGASMFFHSLGYPVPKAEFGLLAEIVVSMVNLIL